MLVDVGALADIGALADVGELAYDDIAHEEYSINIAFIF